MSVSVRYRCRFSFGDRANGVIVVLREILVHLPKPRLTLSYVPDGKVTVLKRLSGWQPDPPWLSLGDSCLTKLRFIRLFQAFATSLICDIFLLQNLQDQSGTLSDLAVGSLTKTVKVMIAAFEVDTYLLIVHDLILICSPNPASHKKPIWVR
jgi:hypothetical protein